MNLKNVSLLIGIILGFMCIFGFAMNLYTLYTAPSIPEYANHIRLYAFWTAFSGVTTVLAFALVTFIAKMWK